MIVQIFPPEDLPEATIELPLSKSEAARSMVCRCLAGQNYDELRGICRDTEALGGALEGLAQRHSVIDVSASGTAMRIMTALCAATDGFEGRLTGDDSLRARPVRDLVDTLRLMGAEISYGVREGYPPLDIRGHSLKGGKVSVNTDTSTQYATALLLAAPLMEEALELTMTGNAERRPYVDMTARIMAAYGAEVDCERDFYRVAGKLRPSDFRVSRDWSAAAFWYELTAISAGFITLTDLSADSLQGDSRCREIFAMLGAVDDETPEGMELSASPDLYGSVEADLSDIPDCIPALAVTAVMTGVPFRFSGTGALRFKECDRQRAIINELEKVGVRLETDKYDTELVWDGSRMPITALPVFDTYKDHRMAMALAPVSVFVPGIAIRGAECVEKSYPGYWEHLQNCGFTVREVSQEALAQ